MLHRIWQRTGKYPTEILNIPPEDISREGLQAFIFASEMVAIEKGHGLGACPMFGR